LIDDRSLVGHRRSMPRTARASVGGLWDHALNRGNRPEAVLLMPGDSDPFVEAMLDEGARVPVDLLGSCLMPNHFPLGLRPHHDGDLGRWMQWLPTVQARRYHRRLGLESCWRPRGRPRKGEAYKRDVPLLSDPSWFRLVFLRVSWAISAVSAVNLLKYAEAD
jgi:hypothetical protein